MTLQDFYKLWPIVFAALGTIVGWAVTYGKVKARMDTMVTKEELNAHCEATRRRWSDEVGTKIAGVNKSIKDMENLVIRLHNSQSKKIDLMDDKRESAKDSNSKTIGALSSAIGRIEGRLDEALKKD